MQTKSNHNRANLRKYKQTPSTKRDFYEFDTLYRCNVHPVEYRKRKPS